VAAPDQALHYQVFDLTGRLADSGALYGDELNLNLNAGAYILKIISTSGQQILSERIIIY
jgi:hypothetical protein